MGPGFDRIGDVVPVLVGLGLATLDDRRDGSASMVTQWLDDTFGPDQIRVTIAVEPAVQRLVRERDQWTVQRRVPWQLWMTRVQVSLRDQLPAVIQQRVLGGRWAVAVQADSGQKKRLLRPTRDEAWALATSIAESVRVQGVTALSALK